MHIIKWCTLIPDKKSLVVKEEKVNDQFASSVIMRTIFKCGVCHKENSSFQNRRRDMRRHLLRCYKRVARERQKRQKNSSTGSIFT